MAKLNTETITDALSIDEERLDKCWIEQPQYVFKFSMALAKHRLKLEEMKNEIKVFRAELGGKIRSNPEDYDLEKITEKAVEETVASSDELQELQALVTKQEYTISIYQAALVALEHRKYALRDLVSLRGQEYYSEPGIRGLAKQAFEKSSNLRKRRKRATA